MSLKCGIVGLTNIGKTTIFNCISNTKAQLTEFAYSTLKTNIGIVNIPDERLYNIDKIIKSAKVVPTTVEIVDIPGLAKGASHGEGIGNRFLSDIRNTDAIIHVLRCFDDDNLPHIEGSIDPVRDKEIIEFELQLKDIESIEKKIHRLEKVAKSGDKDAKKSLEILNICKKHIESFKPVRTAPIDKEDKKHIFDIFLLTEKPVLYVCNVDEASAIKGNKYVEQVKKAVQDEKSNILVIAGALEADIAELETEEERLEFLKDAGLKKPGVNKLIRFAYDLLNFQTFLTMGPKEVRAWTIKKGMTAQQAAGVIHSDLERGFIRAEVIKYNDFITLGSEQACKEAGKLSVEGKNYIVEDGDLMYIRFNV